MSDLKKLLADMGQMAIDFKPPDFTPLTLDYPHSLFDNINFEVEPNPIYATNELLTEQNDLLRKQLEALQKQNEELKKQAEESAEEAKRSKMFAWITFGISTIIAIIALFAG